VPPIGVLVDQWPALGTDSTTQMNFLLVEELSRRGQEVIVLKPLRESSETPVQTDRRDALSKMPHVRTMSLSAPEERLSLASRYLPEGLRWRRRNWYWQLQCADALAGMLRDHAISLIFAYGDTGLAWLASTVAHSHRRVVLGDRPDLPYRYRQHPPFTSNKRFFSLRWWIRWILIWRLRRDFLQLIQRLGAVECVSAEHAADIRRNGGEATYCRSAVSVGAPKASDSRGRGLKLLVLGNLSGTANYEGFVRLARDVAPQLRSELSTGDVSIRVVGGGIESVPASDLGSLRESGVHVLGYVEDLDAQYDWADCLLIPTSIPLGVRIRTIEGWSRGLPTIGHSSIALGLPEALDRLNCRLSDDSIRTAQIIKDLMTDPLQLMRLQSSASDTFRNCFWTRTKDLAEELIESCP
jgi:hypothetical protein